MKLFGKRRNRRPFVSATTLDTAFSRRSFVVGAGMGGIGILLASRMAYLSIAEHEKYTLEAESNRVNLALIPPRRGWVLDRYGAPLASNRADFRVDVVPERMTDPVGTIRKLGDVLGLTADQVADVQQRASEAVGAQPIEVAAGLDYDKFAAVSVRLPDLHGVVPQRGFSRYYPTGPSVAHLIGYVGPANAEEYKKEHNPLLVTPGFKIGKDGLEKSFDQQLRGVPGARRVEVTASGRIVKELETREDVQGQFGPTDHRRAFAGLRRPPHRARIGRRGGDRLPDRGHPGAGFHAGLRSQQFRRGHRPQALGNAQLGRSHPAAQQGDAGPLPRRDRR